MERGRNSDACSILESLVHVSGSSTRLCNKALRDQARFKLVSVLMEAKKEYGRAHDHIKMLSSKHPYSIKVWNMYSQVVGKLGSVKWYVIASPSMTIQSVQGCFSQIESALE